MIYFIEAKELGFIKIGHTRDVVARFYRIGTSCPVSIKLLGTMEGGFELERELHGRFAAYRHHFEWFRDTPELRTFIAENATPWPERASSDGHSRVPQEDLYERMMQGIRERFPEEFARARTIDELDAEEVTGPD